MMNRWQESTLHHYEVHVIGQVPVYFHIDFRIEYKKGGI